MSWDAYVDNLCASGIITQATIIGLNGAIWTPSGAKDNILVITQEEASFIGATMKAAKPDPFQAKGITLNKIKYMFLRDMDGDGKVITGKKAALGNIILSSTAQAVIIAFIPEVNADAARSATGIVEKIAQYLFFATK